MRLLKLIPLIAVIGLLCAAAPASAATRYASPGGTGPAATCPQSNPCNLQTAVEDAAVVDGDDVIVLPGTYNESDQLSTTDAITLRGESAASPPTIDTTGAIGVLAVNPGVLLRNLRINHTGGAGGFGLFLSGTGERLRVSSTEQFACLIGNDGGSVLLRDSTCSSTNPSGTGVALRTGASAASGTNLVRVRNVTVYAFGIDSVGVQATADSGANVNFDARNVIASGGFVDVAAGASGGSTTTVTLASSNFATAAEGSMSATVTDPGTGDNQTAAPQLVDSAAGDFTQLPTSPTIDAGTTDSFLGATDLAGDPRTLGTAPDIGADETLETTPPETTIDSGPAGATADDTPTFTFSSNELGSTFSCSIDGAPTVLCASPLALPALTDGSHTLQVRGFDPSGNPDPTPAERLFTVDTRVDGALLRGKKKQRQKGGAVAINLTAGAGEALELRVSGTVAVGSKRFALRPVTRQLDAAVPMKLKLKPKRSSSTEKILDALAGGVKAKATISSAFTDPLGNIASKQLKVSLKEG